MGKTAAQKALDRLVSDGDIMEKAYGKQTVYVVSQTSSDAPSQDELNTMDDTIDTLKLQLAEVKEEWKGLSARMFPHSCLHLLVPSHLHHPLLIVA